MDLYEFDEREKEQDGMEIVIDGLKIEIPEELIQERMELMCFDTREDVVKDIKDSLSGYLKCLDSKKINNPLLNDEIIEWLHSEMQIYNPNSEFGFNPILGLKNHVKEKYHESNQYR